MAPPPPKAQTPHEKLKQRMTLQNSEAGLRSDRLKRPYSRSDNIW